MYEIQLFGPVEVRTRGVRLSGDDLGGVRPRHILALLALRGALSVGELAELLWDRRPPVDHRTALAREVSTLRRRLDPEGSARHSVIIERQNGYDLDTDRVRTDVARFDELVAAAAWRTPGRAVPPLTAAAHLAGLPLLDGEVRRGWVLRFREQYRGRLVETLVGAGERALAAGLPGAAAHLSARALAADPYAERAWYVNMAAYRATGDRDAALSAFDDCRRRFVQGRGVEPPAPIQTLLLELLCD